MTRTDQSAGTEFEVAPTMHMDNSRDPIEERPAVDDKLPVIEQHITNIPQHDDTTDHHPSSKTYNASEKSTSDGNHKETLKQKLKRHLPGHHSSESNNEAENSTVDLTKEDSGSSDFEIAGFMPMTSHGSSDSASGSLNTKPNLERHISSIPEKDNDLDGEEEEDMSEKSRRTIPHVSQKD